MMNSDAAAIHVKSDSPYKTVKELFAAIKANPGKMTASGTGQGGSWHLALAGLMQADGVPPNSIRWVPSTGAATALTDLAGGGVDFVSCSMPEAEALIKAGRVRSLTVMSPKRAANFPDVPAVEEATGHKWFKGVWRAIVGPKGMSKEIAAQYETLLKNIYDSAEYKEFMSKRGFDLAWMDAAQFTEFLKKDDAEIGEILKSLESQNNGCDRLVNRGWPTMNVARPSATAARTLLRSCERIVHSVAATNHWVLKYGTEHRRNDSNPIAYASCERVRCDCAENAPSGDMINLFAHVMTR